MEFLRAGAGPYRQLAGYLKPYKARFGLGILFGALYGLMNGGMVLTIKFVGEKVFGTKDSSKEFEKLVDKLPEGDVAEEGGAFNAVREVFKEASSLDTGTALTGSLMLAAMLVPAIMLLRGFCGYMNSYCMLWVSLRVLSDIRIRLFICCKNIIAIITYPCVMCF